MGKGPQSNADFFTCCCCGLREWVRAHSALLWDTVAISSFQLPRTLKDHGQILIIGDKNDKMPPGKGESCGPKRMQHGLPLNGRSQLRLLSVAQVSLGTDTFEFGLAHHGATCPKQDASSWSEKEKQKCRNDPMMHEKRKPNRKGVTSIG